MTIDFLLSGVCASSDSDPYSKDLWYLVGRRKSILLLHWMREQLVLSWCFFVCLFFLFLQNELKEVRTYGIKWMVGFPSSRAQHGRGAPN